MQEEYESFLPNDTWELVHRREARSVIGGKRIFRIKSDNSEIKKKFNLKPGGSQRGILSSRVSISEKPFPLPLENCPYASYCISRFPIIGGVGKLT
jgi:hypothetical protein